MHLDPACRGLALGLAFVAAACAAAPGAEPEVPQTRVSFAATGRVEGATELIEIGTAMDGVLRELRAREGDRVEAGTTLAELVCAEPQAALEARRAELASALQAQKRILRGARDEERSVARAAATAALAERTYARLRCARAESLGQGEALISRDELEDAQRARGVAEARYLAAVEVLRLAEAGPLPEERARAEAEADAAAKRVRQAAMAVEKCTLRAPIAGTVLRVHLSPGEQVSVALPRAVLSMADSSRLRVRAEVDERDVGRVRLGQTARIQAEALDGGELQGRVAEIEPLMGRKRTRSGDPAEKNDRDVLEVLVDLDGPDPRLFIGLRVTVLFGDGPQLAGRSRSS